MTFYHDIDPRTWGARDVLAQWLDIASFRVAELAAAKHRRRAPRPRAGKVSASQVPPAVLKEALRLAGGDARRLQIVDATTIIVRNQPGPGGIIP